MLIFNTAEMCFIIRVLSDDVQHYNVVSVLLLPLFPYFPKGVTTS